MKTIAQQLSIKDFPFIIKDNNRNQIYFENSDGEIINNRPKTKELTMDEIAEKFNIPVEQLKIKK
jgi:hypothetical protein